MRQSPLRFLAGPGAFAKIREGGFEPGRIGTIAGASGGAKWLVLSQIDRVIIDRILPRLEAPVHLIGSSIGAWRFTCYAQDDPLAAIARFEEAYLDQHYSDAPDRREISDKSEEILRVALGGGGARQIVNHPVLRTHIMATRARFTAASERTAVLGTTLAVAATANILSRRSLGAFFKRSLFYDSRDLPPFFDVRGFPIEQIELTEHNLTRAVLASGAIPLVLSGVTDIGGAPRGVYRDRRYHRLPSGFADQCRRPPHAFSALLRSPDTRLV